MGLGQVGPVILDPRMTPALSYLHVMVWDEDNDEPIEGADVVAETGGTEWRLTTDELGVAHFGFPSAPGTPVGITVEAPGFVTETSRVETQAEQTAGPLVGMSRGKRLAPVIVLGGIIALGAAVLS